MRLMPIFSRRDFLGRSGISGLTALSLSAGSTITGNSAAAKDLTSVNIVNTSGDIGLTLQTLLRRLGYLQEFGLEADIVNVADGTKIMGALISGDGDICTASGINQLFPAIAAGAKIKVIGGAQTLPDLAIFSKRPDIREVKDLVGKTVGAGAPGALLYEAVVALLLKKGVDPTKVTFVNIGSSSAVFQAVVAGKIDAGPCASDIYYRQAKFHVHSLTDSTLWTELPEYTYQASYTSDRAIAAHRDALVRVLAAYTKLYRFVQGPASKDAFIEARVSVSGPKSVEQGEAQWTFIQKYQPFAKDPVLSEAQINYVQKLNVDLGVQKSILPFEQVADMSLARDARQLAG